jgi:hypothetical protein
LGFGNDDYLVLIGELLAVGGLRGCRLGQHPQDEPEVLDPVVTLGGYGLGGPKALAKDGDLGPETVDKWRLGKVDRRFTL